MKHRRARLKFVCLRCEQGRDYLMHSPECPRRPKPVRVDAQTVTKGLAFPTKEQLMRGRA